MPQRQRREHARANPAPFGRGRVLQRGILAPVHKNKGARIFLNNYAGKSSFAFLGTLCVSIFINSWHLEHPARRGRAKVRGAGEQRYAE